MAYMAIKYLRQIIFVSLFLAALNPSLWGQIDENGFFQRLRWTGGEYAMHYEVIIEAQEAGVYRTAVREITEEQYIRVSLSPGRFRIQVIPYDFLYRPGTPSQWMSFEVLPIHDQEFFIGSQEREPGLDPGLVTAGDDQRRDRERDRDRDRERDRDMDRDRDRDRDITATPMGADIFLSMAWMPLFTIYGERNRFLVDNSTVIGLASRLGVVNNTWNLNPGVELGMQWYALNATANTPTFYYLTLELNFLAQTRLNELTAVNFRFGGGGTLRLNTFDISNLRNPRTESGALFANIGVSFQYFLREPFFIELGMDYSHLFTRIPAGTLRPWFGGGVRF